LLKRKWVIFWVFMAVVVTTVVVVLWMTPIYKATAILQITQDNPGDMLGAQDALASLFASETQGRFYESQYLILNSRSMGNKIIDSLNMLNHPEFLKFKENYTDESPEEIRSQFVTEMLKNLEVTPLKRSFLVEVSYRSPDPVLAQQVVNIVSTEYMKLSMDTRRQSYDMIRNWLEGELHSLASKVEDSESKLYKHGQEKDFYSLDDKNNTIVKKFVELSMLYTKAQSDRMLKEAQFKQIKEQGADAPLVSNNPLIMRLREESIVQEGKVASLLKIYDVNYPSVIVEQTRLKDLTSRLSNEVKRTTNTIEADYKASLRAEKLLFEAQEAQKKNVGNLQTNLVKHHILKRDMHANEQIYQGLLARMKEASVASTMVASNSAVIDAGEFPFKRDRPRRGFSLLLASIIGLTGGIGLAFLLEYLDNSIKSVEEMERLCSFPTLGVVPLISIGKEDKTTTKPTNAGLEIITHPQSVVAEAIRQIRTSIMLSSSPGPPAAFMVTSPNPSEGKSTMATNLSVSMAINGRKVVLIDADLRKPSIQRILNTPLQPGLSNYLAGDASASDIIRPTEIPNLFFIPAGTIPPRPAELLNSKAFEDLLQDLRGKFQHLVIDTPPIIGFADGRVLSSHVEGVLLVVRHNYTTRESIVLAKQFLNQVNARIIGVVLNMSFTNRSGYGYYYGYSSHYSKYYHSGDGKELNS
ncbi:MAG: polysaccharide biosynthesis tyrosine autokinase, partial [Bacteroidales bacterium]